MNSQSGFSLASALMGLAFVGIMGYVIMQTQKSSSISSAQTELSFRAEIIIRNTAQILLNRPAWDATVASTANNRTNGPALDCISNSTPCTTNGTDAVNLAITNFDLKEIRLANNVVYANLSNSSFGFSTSGQPCTTFIAAPASGSAACPFRPRVKWTAMCNASSCVNPAGIKLELSIEYNPPTTTRLIFNAAKHTTVIYVGF